MLCNILEKNFFFLAKEKGINVKYEVRGTYLNIYNKNSNYKKIIGDTELTQNGLIIKSPSIVAYEKAIFVVPNYNNNKKYQKVLEEGIEYLLQI